MQERKKRRIVLASVLKPVDDTRMFGKFAQTLSAMFDVHVFGFPSPGQYDVPGITIHPHSYFKRMSLERLLSAWRIFFEILKLRPEAIVVTTHELLIEGVLLRFLTGAKLCYDVQENYYLNITTTEVFPEMIRDLVGFWVRSKEKLAAPFVDQFILAERIYEAQLPFTMQKFTIIENKALPPAEPRVRKSGRARHFIFTGTLARTTGVFEAIDLVTVMHAYDPSVRLTIAGHAAIESEAIEIRRLTSKCPYITTVGVEALIPHAEILNLIHTADVGIISYEPGPATAGRVPTKLYEYMVAELPVLVRAGASWVEFVLENRAGIIYDPQRPEPAAILKKLQTWQFYEVFPAAALWENEAPKLLNAFASPKE